MAPRTRGRTIRARFASAVDDLAIIETILRNRQRFFADIRDSTDLSAKMRAMFVSSVVFLALYGSILGSTHSVLQALSSAVKLPLLFLATLVVTTPTLYFFNILAGSDQNLRQNLALVLTAITVTSVILLSFAPISLFFLLTTSQYQFFKLLNVFIMAVSGLIGVRFFSAGMRALSRQGEGQGIPYYRVVWLWVIAYAFVGSQMAWTLRPFVGAPSMGFELFRQLGGNFYTNILASLGELFGFFVVA